VSHGARATAGVEYAAATSREKSKISPTPQAEGAARIKGARSQREDAKLVKVEFQLHRLVIGRAVWPKRLRRLRALALGYEVAGRLTACGHTLNSSVQPLGRALG
jgi:hypothetical protein